MKNKTTTQLKKLLHDAREELSRRELAEKESANQPLIGKFFKYRNCYSCPEKASDYWFVYRYVTGQKDGYLESVDFSVDKNGDCNAQRNTLACMSGWTEISAEEFCIGRKAFMEKVNSIIL